MTDGEATDHTGPPTPGAPGSGKLADRAALRRRAALAGHRGDPGEARALLGHDDDAVRATALGALVRCDDLLPADLSVARADPSPTVRRRLAELLPSILASTRKLDGVAAGVEAEEVLGPLLSDGDPTVVDAAAWASGEAWQAPEDGEAAAPAPILDRLSELAVGHTDSLVRESAVAALGSIGHPRGLPAILQACTDRGPVRRRAVLALAPFSGPDVDAALARATTDRDWQVRQAAEDLQ